MELVLLICIGVGLGLYVTQQRITKLERQLKNTQLELVEIKRKLQSLLQPKTTLPEDNITKTETANMAKADHVNLEPINFETLAPTKVTQVSDESSVIKSSNDNRSNSKSSVPTAKPLSTEKVKLNAFKEDAIDQWVEKLIANIKNNWLVWIGGLAMLIGGGYLTQEVSKHIEFSPITRMIGVFLISFIVLGLGEWLHRKQSKIPQFAQRISGFTYIPAAVTATGLTCIYCASLFASLYYDFISTASSFIILIAVISYSFATSLRQGPLLSALGLVGGYLAPFWVGSINEWLLMGYFSAIVFVAFALSLRQGKIIALLALAGGYLSPSAIIWMFEILTIEWMSDLLANTPLVIFYFLLISLAGLALSLRYGKELTACALAGGYLTPFLSLWSADGPHLYLLMGAVSLISLAATVLVERVRLIWLSSIICASQLLWILILMDIASIFSGDSLFNRSVIFLSFTTYLVFAVPKMGWKLQLRYRHASKSWHYLPLLTAFIIAMLLSNVMTLNQEIDGPFLIYAYVLLLAIIWLPALRQGYSRRLFLPVIPIVGVFMLEILIKFFQFYDAQTANWALLLVMLAISIALICARTTLQHLYTNRNYDDLILKRPFTLKNIYNDHRLCNALLLLIQAPTMTLLTLIFCYKLLPSAYVWGWGGFVTLVAGFYIWLGLRLNILAKQSSAIAHVLLMGSLFILVSDIWLTVAISMQIALMALQVQQRIFPPASWIIKVAMGALIARLTLLPLIPQWQVFTHIEWALCYLLALAILGYARMILQKSNSSLANWFEGSMLHVFLLAVLTQTNYWLTGEYGYPTQLTFTAAIVFMNQTLAMGLIYGYRCQFSEKLKRIYQGYSFFLWGIFGLLCILLNTFYSPLLVEHVSATVMPIFNIMMLGWLLPAAILFATVKFNWPIPPVQPKILIAIGLALCGIWLGMSIRQFWQTASMRLTSATGVAELFSYSIAGLIVGALSTWAGALKKHLIIQRVGLVTLAFVALKVFVWDVRSLEGFWRAVSFLCLGGSLIALGWLFQKLNRPLYQESSNDEATE